MKIKQVLCISMTMLLTAAAVAVPGLYSQKSGHVRGNRHISAQLNEQQRAELRTMIQQMREQGADREEIREAVKNKFAEWGISADDRERPDGKRRFMGLLNTEQQKELEQLIDEMRSNGAGREEIGGAVKEKLESWGVEMPERPHRPHVRFMQQLPEQQREEIENLIKNMREQGANHEDIADAVIEKLDEWGIEPPELPLPEEVMEQLTPEQTDELKQTVKSMRAENSSGREIHKQISFMLSQWGIDLPERGHRPHNKMIRGLSQEQRKEIRNMIHDLREAGADRDEIKQAVQEKLDEWGIAKTVSRSNNTKTGIEENKDVNLRVHPNPFNMETVIHYTLAAEEQVNVSVYNIQGQAVRVLEDGVRNAGHHQVVWNGTNMNGNAVPSGMYICHLTVGGQTITVRMTLMK